MEMNVNVLECLIREMDRFEDYDLDECANIELEGIDKIFLCSSENMNTAMMIDISNVGRGTLEIRDAEKKINMRTIFDRMDLYPEKYMLSLRVELFFDHVHMCDFNSGSIITIDDNSKIRIYTRKDSDFIKIYTLKQRDDTKIEKIKEIVNN